MMNLCMIRRKLDENHRDKIHQKKMIENYQIGSKLVNDDILRRHIFSAEPEKSSNLASPVIFDKIADPVLQKLSDVWELSDRFEKLQKILPMAQAVIQDAEERQVKEEAVRIWLSQLKDATVKVEDLLEEFWYGQKSVNFSQHQQSLWSGDSGKSRKTLDDLQKALMEGFNLRLAERVSVVDRKFDKRETSSFLIGSEVCGREEDKKRILEMLLLSSGRDTGESSFVVPIFGTPGIGKSTLAQMVYNDDEVMKHFNLRIWVFVSPDFNIKRIIKAAIESAAGNKCNLEQLDALQLKLRDILHKKKFLLVLDDVWTEDQDEWDKLRLLLSCGSHGSRILVTTHSQKIPMIIGSSGAYHLKGLSEEDCWALFKQGAFINRLEEEKHLNLLAIGKEIVRKCEGVPLAVKVVGRLLRFKKEEMDWLHVQNSNLWDLGDYREKILPALLISYLQMPPHLKHCLMFCSIFPKNYEIDRKTIIHMWMANGFILSDGESKALEDIGDEYFNELLWMSVLDEVRECEGDYSVRRYKMNETFLQLVRCLDQYEFLALEKGLPLKSVGQVRHVSIVPEFGYRPNLIPQTLSRSKHLRTLLVFSEGGLETVPMHIFSSFVYLRVLKLRGCHTELPESIGGLKILRYLDLSYSHFRNLPSSISGLYFLQVLNLFCCYNLTHLPELFPITGLRHLDICGCEALLEIPFGIKVMVYLQTLPIYIVPIKRPQVNIRLYANLRRNCSTDSSYLLGKSMRGSLYDIQHLDLRDELKVKHLERVRDVEEAKAANLTSKAHLKSLGLCWGSEGSDFIMRPALEANAARFQEQKVLVSGLSNEPETNDNISYLQLAGEVLEALQPNKNLKKLFVVGYPGIRFPIWTLPNLVKVVLIKCEECLHLPILGHLPLLKSLHMERMRNIRAIGQEFYGEDVAISFPSLEELLVVDFPNLHEWSSPDRMDIFPVISRLTIKKCQNLVSVPLFMSLKHLELQECNSAVLKCMEESSQLSSLVIDGLAELESVPENLLREKHHLACLKISSCPKLQCLASEFTGLPSLKSLTIRWCEVLSVLPQGFQNLTCLESLEISDCHSLITLPENVLGHLTSLQTLSIENCSLLNSISIGFQNLTALEYLSIMYCPSLAAFPENPEHLSALRSLSIISCPLIEFLPEGIKNATELRSLEIRSCHRITHLPEWLDNFVSLRTLAISDCHNLKSLPVAVRRLSKLQHLSILDCPDLQRCCQPDTGEDWWKIAHIPHRYILSSQRQQSSESEASNSSIHMR